MAMTDKQESIPRIVAEWLKGQPFNNVMAVLLLGAMTGLGYVAIFHVVPAERIAIQSMAEHMEQEQTKQIDRVCEAFEKGLDRMQSRALSGQNKVASKEER